jgi:hypothetical protein
MAPWYLPALYAQVARYLRPDGLLINVDFMWNLQPGLREQVQALSRSRMTTEWQAFNQSFEQYPVIQQFALAEHEQRTRWNEHHAAEVHRQALASAGFKFADEVWRYLNHAMILAVK